jgi:uroporphyrinogen-III synthase
MSKKTKAGHSLAGIRVLVGRAKHQAGALSAELRKRGASVIEIPFIEIRKPKSFKALDAALKNLGTYDWLILTSVNGVEAMWNRLEKMKPKPKAKAKSAFGTDSARRLRIAAIGPATRKAIEQRGAKVDIVPEEYIAESIVTSLKGKVRGNRVLLVRARVARDVIPKQLRKAGAHVEVVEAYETVVPQRSRARLRAALKNPSQRPHLVTFTSSSTVKNFVKLLGSSSQARHKEFAGIQMASIGPVTSATLREVGLPVDIEANEFTIPGLIKAIEHSVVSKH